ncbi:MAG: SIMPL domain-containing protein [Rhodoferax sp.]|nr:SIMPL domain-containing protein [Rhodoferax sp.]MDP3652801.1 SIMPL domain-containing protein [Rhodoferax sp.]
MKFAIKIVAVCAVLTWAGGVFSQVSVAAEPHNVVQLASSGSVDVLQDLLTLTLGTSKEGSDPAAVQSQLRLALETALTEAKKAAQSGAMEVRTGAFGLQPRYGRDGKINGWTGTAELVLEGKDFGRIGTTAGKIQTLTINNAAFSLSRDLRNKTETEAQALAIDRFKAKAAEIAHSFGFGAYTLRDVAVNANDQGYNPRPRMVAMEMKAMAADAPVPMEAGKSAVVVNVSGSVQLK